MTLRRAPNGAPKKFIEMALKSEEEDECIIWPFGVQSRGYPIANIGGKAKLVHQYICEQTNGERHSRKEAAHSCGVKRCINKHHLRWATSSENKQDMRELGELAVGERSGHAKLSSADINEIKLMRALGYQQKEIAEMFMVQQSTISRILAGVRWAHME
jgi:hypothetical protein